MLEELDKFDEVEKLCGIAEIKFEDEVPACVPCIPKKKYCVIFKKTEVVEVEAFDEDEAEELAMVILENDTDAWTGFYDEIIVEEI